MSKKTISTIVLIIIFIIQVQSFALYNLNRLETQQTDKNNLTTIDSTDQINNNQENNNGKSTDKHENNDNVNINSLSKVDSLGSLFVTGTQILFLSNEVYDNIYVSDNAQVYLDNVSVTGDIEVHSSAFAEIANNSWSNRLLMYDTASALITNINSYGSITVSDYASLTISNSNIYVPDMSFNNNATLQFSSSNITSCCTYLYLNDNSTGSFTDSYVYWININANSYTKLTMTNVFVQQYMLVYAYYLSYVKLDSVAKDPNYSYNSITIGISAGSFNHVEILNSDITTISASGSYSYPALTFTVKNSIITGTSSFYGNVTFSADSSSFLGNVYAFADYYYSNSSFPKLSFTNSGSITLTKEPSGSSQYRNMVDVLTLVHTNATIMFIYVNSLILQNYNNIFRVFAIFGSVNDIDGTSIITTGQTILMGGNYFIGGTDVRYLSNTEYTNIYVFNSAQVYLDNVSVTGDIEVHSSAFAEIANNSWSNRLLMYDTASALITNINSYGSITVSDYASLTISNSNIYVPDMSFNNNATLQFSSSNITSCCTYLYLNDNSTGSFTDSYVYWININANSYTKLTMTNVFVQQYMLVYAYYLSYVKLDSVAKDPNYSYNSITIGISAGSFNHVEILNSDITTISASGSYSYPALTFTVKNSIITGTSSFYGNVTFSADSSSFLGNVYAFADYYYSNSSFPKLSFTNSGSITLTKEPSGSSQYRNMVDVLTLVHTNATIMFIYVGELYGYSNPLINLIGSSYGTVHDDGSIIWIDDDSDNDGIADVDEPTYGTNPYKWDSDGDGYGDGEEIVFSTNPLNPASYTVDTFYPSISTTYSNNSIVHKQISFTISASDNRGIRSVKILNGASVIFFSTNDSHIIDTSVKTFPVVINTLDFSDGDYYFVLNVTDYHHLSTLQILHLSIDNSNHPPVVTMGYPLKDNTISNQITVSWSASDPDGDTLTFAISLQPQGSSGWTILASNINTLSYNWDSTTVANGQYRFKIIATDELGSSTELISDYFTVNNVEDTSPSTTTTPPITF